MTNGKSRGITFGMIVGNRGFFPDHLAQSGRTEMLAAIEKAGYRAVAPTPEDTKFGAVESRAEAARCADLFKQHRDEIDGIIVTLPNFGDERAIADTLRMAGLNVPVLIQATPDTPGRMTIRDRRDSFCGKMSACNNLSQYGIPYSLTTLHTEAPDSDQFHQDLNWFAGVCRVVRGLRRLRIGAIGARPAAFNTVRYSEKILEANGISVEPIDLSEILGRIARMGDTDPDKAVCFHCSNLPKHFFREVKMDFQQIIAGTVGRENTYGTCVGLVKPGPMSFARFSTNDRTGEIHGYVGEGAFTDDPLDTFGGAGVVRIPNLQALLRYICERGFEHHVAANLAPVSAAVREATTRYLGWSVHNHQVHNNQVHNQQ
jgi:L-fucose isomerase-like protein